ncbi:hypothetical protein PanWU01x14_149360 [Parasponia andersonii]|uniref:Uncharacterized protein n=1 Tax=Parasponia andersonii TaxID=3476 RepID=A0A2P5CIV1_PARAD|nr:hypothetical protein PanWU01x14_149360 [Parasponia andersonii]
MEDSQVCMLVLNGTRVTRSYCMSVLSGTIVTHSYLPRKLNLSTTLMITKMILCQGLLTNFTPCNIWDFLDMEKDIERVSSSSEVLIPQERNFSSFQLWVNLPTIENIQYCPEDIEPDYANNVDELLPQTRVMTMDDFVIDNNEFEDDTLEEYNNDEIDSGSSDNISSNVF